MSRARAAYFHLVLLLFGPAPAIAIIPGDPGKEKEGQAAAVTTAKLANIATRRTKMPAKFFHKSDLPSVLKATPFPRKREVLHRIRTENGSSRRELGRASGGYPGADVAQHTQHYTEALYKIRLEP